MADWLVNGQLDIAALDKLEADIRAVSDSNKALDQVVRAAKLGRPMTVAFRCTHSGRFYPSSYAKDWGKKTGIGLGPDIVSECLDSQYHVDPPLLRGVRRAEDVMHPVVVCMAQVDFVVIPEEDFAAGRLILAADDEFMEERIKIIRDNQLRHPESKIRMYTAEYLGATGERRAHA